MKKTSVNIYGYTIEKGAMGNKTKKKGELLEKIDAVVIPTSNEYVKREYGYTDDVEYLLVYKNSTNNLKNGNIVEFNALSKYIVNTINYNPIKNAIICMLNDKDR